MNKFFKKGMTLGELCLVFAIMGVVASMTLIAAKPYDKSIKYAYEKVYSTLNTAFYNAQLNLTDALRDDSAQYSNTNKCNEDNEHLCVDGTFPMNTYTLCYMLTQYINTSQGTARANCTADAVPVGGENPTTVNGLLKDNPPHITASNGVKYWIISFSKNDYDKPTIGAFALTKVTRDADNNAIYTGATASNPNQNRENIRFYGIAADLNGSMGPNSTDHRSDKQIADIVGFAVVDTGDIVPLGKPLHDKRYTTAEVIGPDGQPIPNLPPLSIYQATRIAWAFKEITSASNGNYSPNIFVSPDNSLSLGFTGTFCYYPSTTTNCLAGTKDASVSPFSYKLKSTYNLGETNADTFTTNLTYKTAGKACTISANDENLDPTACYVKIYQYH